MRVLSIRQPWAWFIAAGLKDVENRSWETSYRGTVAIHAGLWCREREIEACLDALESEEIIARPQRPSIDALRSQLGRVVSVGELTDCSPADTHPSAWAIRGSWCFSLGPMRLLEQPVLVHGKLGLFQPTEAERLAIVASMRPPPLITEDTSASRIELVSSLEAVIGRGIVTKEDAIAALGQVDALLREVATW